MSSFGFNPANPVEQSLQNGMAQQIAAGRARQQGATGLGSGVATYTNGGQQSPIATSNVSGSSSNPIAVGFGFGKGYDSGLASQNYNTYANTLAGLGAQSNTMANGNIAQAQALGSQNYMQGAQIAYQQQMANYTQQQGAANMLYNQAIGAVASPADLQMRAGLANANNQAQSAAYSQQGGVSPGLTQRNLLNSQAQQNASIVNQGAQMRAQETMAAQQNYGTMLNNMGQTAANMQQGQYNMGNFQYNQGQTALMNQNAFQQQNLGFQQAIGTNAYNALNNQINTQAGYNGQQAVTAMNSIGALAGAASTIGQRS